MKGYVYYTKEESIRNDAFIKDLIDEAHKIEIGLQLLVDNELPEQDAKFVLFRDRNHLKAQAFELQGFRLFNRAEVNRIANDKLQTNQLANVLGIPSIPTTQIKNNMTDYGFPSVIKTIDGFGGQEVFYCTENEQVEQIIEKYPNRQLIIQPYIESNSQDVRVFMLGNEVVGAVKRTGTQSFKSNYTLGGTIEAYHLAKWQEAEVIQLTQALNSDYIGIDFLLLPDGQWLLNEIEDPVGARSLYKTHDFSIAEKIMKYIEHNIRTEDYY